MNQFTVIITAKKRDTARRIKQGHKNLEEISKTYFETGKGHRILLKPPEKNALKGYDADVVVNETLQTHLTGVPGGKNVTTVQVI